MQKIRNVFCWNMKVIELKYQPAVKSLRLLGSNFFNEVQVERAGQKTKVYDAIVLEVSENHEINSSMDSGHTERACHRGH